MTTTQGFRIFGAAISLLAFSYVGLAHAGGKMSGTLTLSENSVAAGQSVTYTVSTANLPAGTMREVYISPVSWAPGNDVVFYTCVFSPTDDPALHTGCDWWASDGSAAAPAPYSSLAGIVTYRVVLRAIPPGKSRWPVLDEKMLTVIQ
jgi:hypothetical protein